jgi:electron transfer flavoprotein beta subunit
MEGVLNPNNCRVQADVKIIVFLKQVADIKIPLGYDDATGTVKEDWNVPVLNPEDRAAMEAALGLRARFPGTRVTLVHLGPPGSEGLIREGLSLGCDEGLRIWDEDLDGLHVQSKALILSRVARILSFDLLLLGARSRDTGNSQLGLLLASSMEVPCVSRATNLSIEGDRTVVATRRLTEGYQERVEAAMPLVLTMEASEEPRPYAGFAALLAACEREIPCWRLSDIGVPPHLVREIESRLSFGRLGFAASRLRHVPAPDSSLPAFERREKLREGSMKKRAGRVVKGEPDHVAEELFQTLLKNGWLDHLGKSDK